MGWLTGKDHQPQSRKYTSLAMHHRREATALINALKPKSSESLVFVIDAKRYLYSLYLKHIALYRRTETGFSMR